MQLIATCIVANDMMCTKWKSMLKYVKMCFLSPHKLLLNVSQSMPSRTVSPVLKQSSGPVHGA